MWKNYTYKFTYASWSSFGCVAIVRLWLSTTYTVGQWFNERLNNNDFLGLTFFTDESWFYIFGYVNIQNYRTWATKNPHNFVEKDLHPLKVGIWIAISRRRIIAPIFLNYNAGRHQTVLLTEFINQLHDDEISKGYFQQDQATSHTAQTTRLFTTILCKSYYKRRPWPPRSPDFTPAVCNVFESMKRRKMLGVQANGKHFQQIL